MERFLKYSLTALAILSASSTFAQKRWTLEDCITYALQNNIQIKREVLQTQNFKKDHLSSYLGFTPTLSAGLNHDIQIGRFFNTNTATFETNPQGGSVNIGGTLDLFLGLNRVNFIAQSKYDMLASLEGVEELKRNVSINIAALYLQVLLANENYFLAIKRLEISTKQFESSKQQYELGRISNTDFLQIKAQSIDEKAQLTNALNTRDRANLELAQMLELQTIEGFEIVTDNITIPNDTVKLGLNQYYEEALVLTPSIKRAGYNKRSADKRYSIALGAALPRLSLDYGVYSPYSDQGAKVAGTDTIRYPTYSYRDQVNDNVQKSISFRLAIPIYGRLQNQIRISKAKIAKLDAQYAIEEAEKLLLRNIQQAYSDAKGGYYRYQSMIESEASFSEVYMVNEERFNLGMINAVDYGIARNNYIKAQGDLLHAKYSYLFKLKILDFYRGIPITL